MVKRAVGDVFEQNRGFTTKGRGDTGLGFGCIGSVSVSVCTYCSLLRHT